MPQRSVKTVLNLYNALIAVHVLIPSLFKKQKSSERFVLK